MGHELGDPTAVSVITPVYVTNRVYFKEAFDYLQKNDE